MTYESNVVVNGHISISWENLENLENDFPFDEKKKKKKIGKNVEPRKLYSR